MTGEEPTVLEVVITLKPLTCIPNTIVGPVETAVEAGTVEVATTQGPPGLVDSQVSVWLDVRGEVHWEGSIIPSHEL